MNKVVETEEEDKKILDLVDYGMSGQVSLWSTYNDLLYNPLLEGMDPYPYKSVYGRTRYGSIRYRNGNGYGRRNTVCTDRVPSPSKVYSFINNVSIFFLHKMYVVNTDFFFLQIVEETN